MYTVGYVGDLIELYTADAHIHSGNNSKTKYSCGDSCIAVMK